MSVRGRLMKDYTGRVFGELVVVRYAGRDKGNRALWLCSCSCGGEITTLAYHLNHGMVKSCGHLRREKSVLNLPLTSARGRPVRHPLYVVWNNMIARCYNHKNRAYSDYGGRGITVCRRWHFYANFYDDNADKWKAGLQIDRKDNNKGYWPANVRFVTRTQNANNTRAVFRKRERDRRVADEVLRRLRALHAK